MKNILLICLLLGSLSGVAYAALYVGPVTGTCAVDTNNNLHVLWSLFPSGQFVADTYSPSGALVVHGTPFGPYGGWDTPMIADGPGNDMYLGWFDPGNNEYGSWLLSGTDNMQSAFGFQYATPPAAGSGEGATTGPAHWYGYQVDIEGNGLFGLDWTTTISNQITGNVYSTAGPNSQNYLYYAYSQGSITLGYTPAINPHNPDGFPINLNINSSGDTTAVDMGGGIAPFLSTTPFYNSAGQFWQPVGLTTTPNGDNQVIWQSGSSTSKEIGIWDINGYGHMYGSPNIQLGPYYQFVAAAANPYGGDGQIRIIVYNQASPGMELLTVNPANWAVTTTPLSAY